ncbi:transcription termination factor, RNA polymerase [Trichuris trichiura]|uniref:Transcription termination factor, RNA polymerase n=1 Tax=Trichuris trichiura TaxID=36087 RepID=A0A077Z0F3_TRITR|nr:transcription termination factor, RNA polymerase [Trichuris trichiura]
MSSVSFLLPAAKKVHFTAPPNGLTCPLMIHQRQALTWLLWREQQVPNGGILADEMGLGKTLSMLSLVVASNSLSPEKVQRSSGLIPSKSTLIICPASILYQWEAEVKQRLRRGLYFVFFQRADFLVFFRLAGYDLVLTTYKIVSSGLSKNKKVSLPLRCFVKLEKCDCPLFSILWNRIILDEAHTIKSPSTDTAQACCRLEALSRWALTGTPIHNNVKDLYSLLKFLRFRPFDDNQVWNTWMQVKTGRIKTSLSSDRLRFNWRNQHAPTTQGSGNIQIIVMLLRLRQACCHMALVKQAFLFLLHFVDSYKALLFFRRSIWTVIVSQWVSLLKIISYHLRKNGITFTSITSKVTPEERTKRVERFNSLSSDPQVMLLSLTAGGVGLNLIGGNHLFILDLHWNPALELQAADRIHRVGQSRPVFIHKLVCVDTIEEKVLDLQQQKLQLAHSVLTGVASNSMQKLSFNDLRFLFELEKGPSASADSQLRRRPFPQ